MKHKLYEKTVYRVKLVYNFVFTNKRKLLTLRIIILSAYYRLLVKRFSPEKLQKKMGVRDVESSFEVQDKDLTIAYWVGKRIDRVCNKTYWESKCLIKALTAQRMLFKKNIKTTIYLGVAKEDGEMKAHAWLRCGSIYVTGGNGDGYSTVAKFSK